MSSLHSRSYLFNFNLRIQYCRGIAAFQSCCPKFSQKIQVLEIAILFGYFVLGWILTSSASLCFTVRFWGGNTCFLVGQENIYLKNSITCKAILFPSSIIFPAYQFKLFSSCVYINEITSLICEILIFCTPELSLSLKASYSL